MAAQQDGGSGAWSQEAAVEPAPGGPDSNVDAAFKLQVEEGATVSATFPFFGDPDGGQLSFQIGDHIKVRREKRGKCTYRMILKMCWMSGTDRTGLITRFIYSSMYEYTKGTDSRSNTSVKTK